MNRKSYWMDRATKAETERAKAEAELVEERARCHDNRLIADAAYDRAEQAEAAMSAAGKLFKENLQQIAERDRRIAELEGMVRKMEAGIRLVIERTPG